MFFLFDCDNFFVSCERIFRPDLRDTPVVVLSSNDGCVVSRSYEAKAIPIAMGAPYFKIATTLKSARGVALSSNFELYGDISRRVMSILREEFSSIEVYSIDEAFARITENCDYQKLALSVRNRILRATGISVSVGIAQTKTLCKIASSLAKKKPMDKVQLLTDENLICQTLQNLEILDIWGVGRNLAPRLNFLGIFTAWELCQAPLKMLRGNFGITLEKTVMELRGFSCRELEMAETAQSITVSRSFDNEISDVARLETVLADFVDKACQSLRQQNATAHALSIFVTTNRFHTQKEQYHNSAYVNLGYPCCHTGHFINAMKQGLKEIFRPQHSYKSAGITLLEIQGKQQTQVSLFENTQTHPTEQKLMQAFDNLNAKLGKGTVIFGSQALTPASFNRHQFRSASYTTSWEELAVVH